MEWVAEKQWFLGSVVFRPLPPLPELSLLPPPLLMATTGDAADHMTSWPLLWRQRHSCWCSQTRSHVGAHSLTRKHRSRHVLTSTHTQTPLVHFALPCHHTAQVGIARCCHVRRLSCSTIGSSLVELCAHWFKALVVCLYGNLLPSVILCRASSLAFHITKRWALTHKACTLLSITPFSPLNIHATHAYCKG